MTYSPGKKVVIGAAAAAFAHASVAEFFHPMYSPADPERKILPIAAPHHSHTHSEHGDGLPIGRSLIAATSSSSTSSTSSFMYLR